MGFKNQKPKIYFLNKTYYVFLTDDNKFQYAQFHHKNDRPYTGIVFPIDNYISFVIPFTSKEKRYHNSTFHMKSNEGNVLLINKAIPILDNSKIIVSPENISEKCQNTLNFVIANQEMISLNLRKVFYRRVNSSFYDLNPLVHKPPIDGDDNKLRIQFINFINLSETTDFRLAFKKLHEYCVKNHINFPNQYLKYVTNEKLYPIYGDPKNNKLLIHNKPHFYDPKTKIRYCGSYSKKEITQLVQNCIFENIEVDKNIKDLDLGIYDEINCKKQEIFDFIQDNEIDILKELSNTQKIYDLFEYDHTGMYFEINSAKELIEHLDRAFTICTLHDDNDVKLETLSDLKTIIQDILTTQKQ